MNILSKGRVWLYGKLVRFHAWKYRKLYGMDIGEGTIVNRRANLDKAINPKGIHIGCNCIIAANVVILTHDAFRGKKTDTYIGSNTMIGIRSIILPGVKIGNHVAIGAGSVVVKDIPDHCIAAGNPAKIIKEGIIVINGHIVYPEDTKFQ